MSSLTEPVLRRSSRRLAATLSAQNNVSSGVTPLVDSEVLSCALTSAVLEEKPPTSGHEESEECSGLPAKLQLPPSSENLNLGGIPVFDLFSIYTFLRSFSTLLFLSPFELEEFVLAVKYKVPNLLFDSIHVSLLQNLRKHLELLSGENSCSASNCLRSLNWDLLDFVTWPIFMVDYLLMHSSGLKPGFDLYKLKVFESDYYKQPDPVKIEILRCLCDDVIEVEAIRSELNKRTLSTDSNMDNDRYMKIELSKKRRIEVSGNANLTEEVVDEMADWNSDECCLCRMDGSLICCDGCPAAYHLKCVGVASSNIPEGDWYCPECLIDKNKPWMKSRKSLRGGELLGIDPHERLYYSSCGYLLVLDSSVIEPTYHYYNKDDVTLVIDALKTPQNHYNAIMHALAREWNIFVVCDGSKVDAHAQSIDGCIDLIKGQIPAIPVMPLKFVPLETSAGVITGTVNNFMKMDVPLTSSKGSAEALQSTYTNDFQKSRLDGFNRSTGMLKNSENHRVILNAVDCSLTSSTLDGKEGEKFQSVDCSHTLAPIDARNGDTLQAQLRTSYVNFYGFASSASSVVEELTRKSSDKASLASLKTIEDIVLAQLKAISKRSNKFCWPNIQNLNADARKEKCGWCFSCRSPDDDRDCLFNMNDTGRPLENFTSEAIGLCSKRLSGRGHLGDVIGYIFCIEDRLHGLLSGPWLNPDYSKLWRKNLLKAVNLADLKHLLLVLELNLRPLALSAEWLKQVDTVSTMGSACHIVINSTLASSKHGIGRKRARPSDVETNISSNTSSGLCLFWWRGGRISRHLFNWKVLPRFLASKAARQAGCSKIPDISYTDGPEFAKRSKRAAWQAAVESSRSVGQLALQVRELDAAIRWDDIENTNLLSKMDQFRKSIRPFKKVIIRRKCLEGTVTKYLLDFGKRRIIPDVVLSHGKVVVESSNEKKKYWLEESFVPLHLLKNFEEKRIARKSNDMTSRKLHNNAGVTKRRQKKDTFSYLFSKAERYENYQCGHCNKDVLIREAVSCQHCKGFFHRRHARKSDGTVAAKCIFTCHKCRDMSARKKSNKNQAEKGKKAIGFCQAVRSKVHKKTCKGKKPVESHKIKKNVVAVPLRRSARIKQVSVQNKKLGGRRKRKHPKTRKGTSKKIQKYTWKRKRTRFLHTYWVNGLHLSEIPNDGRVVDFQSKKLLAPSEYVAAILDNPKCGLCCEQKFTSTLKYLACETCRDWFHGDAFGLNEDNIGNVIGFRCHKCRNAEPPFCPHLQANMSDTTKLGELKNDGGIHVAIPDELYKQQKFQSVQDTKILSLVNGICLEEQQSETIPFQNQLETENRTLHHSEEQKAETAQICSEKDGGAHSSMEPNEDVSADYKRVEWVTGCSATVSTPVVTDCLSPKSYFNGTDAEMAG